MKSLAPLCLVALLSAPAFAQAVESETTEQVEVTLRLIEVAVTDKKGLPLTDLERKNFRVTIDGEPREIRTFERSMSDTTIAVTPPSQVPGVAATHEDAASAVPTEAPGRWVVICLDADRIPHIYRKVVLETARAFITEGRPQDRIAVVLLSNGELRYIHDYASPGEFNMRVLEDPGMLLSGTDDLRYKVNEMIELLKPCKVQVDYGSCALTHSDEFLATMRRETSRGMQSLRGLIASMAPLPGRKALVWFSNGFVLQPGEIVLDAMTRYVGDPGSVQSRMEDRGSFAYDNLLVEASRARVSFFSLRAGHDGSYGMRSAENASVPREIAGLAGNPYRLTTTMTEESLRDVAEATGGKAVFTPLVPGLATNLLERLDAIYTLGIDIRPEDRRQSRAKVKLEGRKGKVHSRKRLPGRVQVAIDLVATLDAVPAAPGAASDGERLLLAVEMGRMGLEQTAEFGKRSRVALFSRLIDGDGHIVDSSYRILEVSRNDESESHFVHWLNYRLDEGDYYAEVSISDLVGMGTTTVGTNFSARQSNGSE